MKVGHRQAFIYLMAMFSYLFFKKLDSTNNYLLRNKNLPKATVVIAARQTNGRGQQGKSWYSAIAGNLYLSLVWEFPEKHNIAALSLVVGIAIARVLKQYGLKNFGIKWPNDIYCEQRKLSGILLESYVWNNKLRLVIGVGVNIITGIEEIDHNFISLQEALGQEYFRISGDKNFSKQDFTNKLLIELLDVFADFEIYGWQKFIPEWQNYDLLFNKKIIYKNAEEVVARGVDESGALCVERGNKTLLKLINASEIRLKV